MTLILIAVVLGALAFIAWEIFQLVQRRGAAVRRRERMTKGVAKQKAWDIVFGRRVQKRLPFDGTVRPED